MSSPPALIIWSVSVKKASRKLPLLWTLNIARQNVCCHECLFTVNHLNTTPHSTLYISMGSMLMLDYSYNPLLSSPCPSFLKKLGDETNIKDLLQTYSEVDVSWSVGVTADNILVLLITNAHTVSWIEGIARMTFSEVKLLCLNQSLWKLYLC